ncbi:STAS/SEC14 domain-containing protein [cf. Phormidesmis sp. LEGE 11477]|uniref:STAS/SEC14 domain-containing protein n=1 Tax=cf. Phormidesmis sp. LEGE 11477 TaxID=1828680 RepID=UPI0018811B2E|nr:STAS/SEC14 domain-containing protein [cf. Phormidesmis sp. LEGE 11477]MBE9063416.1 STAS/SEC14 domain-containing protein [cf. Phormidesmis sp. LEGE 11477]
MIEYKNPLGNNVTEMTVEGKVTEADFDRVIKQMTADIEKHGKLRLLEEIRGFEGMDLMTLWKDAQFGLKHVNDFSHVAVVADTEWMRTIAAAAGNVLSAEVKAFDLSSIDAARNWLITASDKTLESGLQYNRVENSPVVEIVIEGKITAADMQSVIKEVETDLAKYEKIRVLEDIRDFKGVDPMALWVDLKQVSKIRNISHAAIIADAKWVKTVAEAIGGLYPFELKVYERSQIAEARAWLAAAS